MKPIIEEWRNIPNNHGYQVSNWGRIQSLSRKIIKSRKGLLQEVTLNGKVLKLALTARGYYSVSLGKNNHWPVHQLVALAFIGPKSDGAVVNHINGIKTDNYPDNLEYTTNSKNVKHAHENGLMSNREKGHSNSKLTPEQVIEIQSLFGKERTGLIAKKYGVASGTIRKLCNKSDRDRIIELELRVKKLEYILKSNGINFDI